MNMFIYSFFLKYVQKRDKDQPILVLKEGRDYRWNYPDYVIFLYKCVDGSSINNKWLKITVTPFKKPDSGQAIHVVSLRVSSVAV